MKLPIIVAALVLLLAGCKTTEPIYYHGGYSAAVYQYLKNDELSIEEQIQLLENIVEMAANKSKPVMPGVHAHLGLLYFDSGNADLGATHFNQEKALFPESTQYIDFLFSNSQKGS